MKQIDIEDLNRHFDECLQKEFPRPTSEDNKKLQPLVQEVLDSPRPLTDTEFRALARRFKFGHKRSFLFQVYLNLLQTGVISKDRHKEDVLRKTLQIKAVKSWSGITSITIFTSPYPQYTDDSGQRVTQSFSCAFDCHYCPKEPGQPRSYLKGEPGVLRANKNQFDCVRQMWDRMNSLFMIGSSPLKCEIIVSGGTWASYPMRYREEFCRDIYYAANTFWDPEPRRSRLDIEEEKRINQTAISRIVGLTIETRPDTIDADEMRSLRRFGVTRVQLGIQHTDDIILDKINRKCPTQKTVKAIEMLKRNCFKIDAHWMPNLPGASPEKDRVMFIDQLLGIRGTIKRWQHTEDATWADFILRRNPRILDEWEEYDLVCPELQTDQWKIYPTAVTPWTQIEQWFKEGTYVQYDERRVFELLYDTMGRIFPWIRCNRVIRDIPHSYIYNEHTGSDNTNLRQELDDFMKKEGTYSMDIRNREVKNKEWDGSYHIVVRKYNASKGSEYFISAESKDNKTLYGFVRLRLDDGYTGKVFPELVGSALIREVKVYGDLSKVGEKGAHVQHKGIGRTLITKAENIAKDSHYAKIAVISAEGTRQYYAHKLGYAEEGSFMTKIFANISPFAQ